MAFLTRSPGLSSREAREILDLDELIQHCLQHGPVPLGRYARIRAVESDSLASWERSARRFVAKLRALGFRITAEGDREELRMDFSVDRSLRTEVARWIEKVCHLSRISDSEAAKEEDCTASVVTVLQAWSSGSGVKEIERELGFDHRKLRIILITTGKTPRPARRPRSEEQRDPLVVEAALKAQGGRGRIARVARILGCSWDAAKRFIERNRSSITMAHIA